ncbi:MAG: hypothetical protein MJ209_02240 [archaeon]|nr:hypothetical protein [archaeon]
MGGDEEAVKNAEPIAAQTAFTFSVVGFGASDNVILGGNNVPDALQLVKMNKLKLNL